MSKPTPLHAEAASAGATFVEDASWLVPAHFGDALHEYEAARTACALFDHSPRGKIEAEGKDAAVFLHNLSSNDVKGLSPGSGCEAFFCNATAKVVSHGNIYRLAPAGKSERFWLDVPASVAEKTFRHLDHFIIGEDVALTDHTAELTQMHLCGPKAAAVLQAALGEDPGEWLRHQHRLLAGVPMRCSAPLGLPGYDLLCPQAQAGDLWAKLTSAGARPAGREAAEILRVEGGVPAYGVDFDETTFAPELGRAALAISYNKGCYLGQEPIVMARDRGVVQRTLVGLVLGEEPAPPGSLLFRDGKEAGRTLSSVRSPRLGAAVALAFARRGSQNPGTEVELDSGGARRTVRVAKLPLV
jgi:folate-binding protein YgfZ